MQNRSIAEPANTPHPTVTPTPSHSTVIPAPLIPFETQFAAFGLEDGDEDGAARTIAEKVINEGVTPPKRQLVNVLHLIIKRDDDFIAAIMLASRYIVGNCRQILETRPNADEAREKIEAWKKTAEPPSEGDRDSFISNTTRRLREILFECLADAGIVFQWMRDGISDAVALPF